MTQDKTYRVTYHVGTTTRIERMRFAFSWLASDFQEHERFTLMVTFEATNGDHISFPASCLVEVES